MSEKFTRSTDVLDLQNNFSDREVGVTHPDISSHIRLRDNGDIEIITGEKLAIVMNRKNASITFVADHVRFLTRDDDTGMRWNKMAFNHKATLFNEPTFVIPADD